MDNFDQNPAFHPNLASLRPTTPYPDLHYQGPVVLVVMDGVGLNPETAGNAVAQAHTEFLDFALSKYPHLPIAASGEAVGITANTMGNSEVGHNTIGSGQIIKQGSARINEAFQSGNVWASPTWYSAIDQVLRNQSTLHFSGILSDGAVHSDINHLEQMIIKANEAGVQKIRIHAIFDGRDVAPQSEPRFIKRLEALFKRFSRCDYQIADGGGRMVITADRYQNDWNMVEKGWNLMVHGRSEQRFRSAETAITTLRQDQVALQDQYIPPFVVVDKQDQPIGKVQDGDSFIYFDFRADRAIEIAMAFTYEDFPYFERGIRPSVYFAGMTEYDADTHVPEHTLVPPVHFSDTLNTVLSTHQVSQLAISETAKFGHITYYFNGNSYNKAPLEEHLKVDSDTLPFDTRPWMKSAEITDLALQHLEEYQFIRINYPGGDMVGHFGEITPAVLAIEAIDLQLTRLARKVDALGGMMLIVSDHGNCEELTDAEGNPKTAHTTNPVPCIFYDNTANRQHYQVVTFPGAGLANLASTLALLCGVSEFPSTWQPPLIAHPVHPTDSAPNGQA